MNNYSKIISNMEEKIKNFSKKISKGVNCKKKRDFVFDMLYGITRVCHLKWSKSRTQTPAFIDK